MGVGVGLQAAGAVAGLYAAKMQRDAYEAEAKSAEENAKMAQIQASQQEVDRMRQLRMQLASLKTMNSAQGVALGTSGSTSALIDNEYKMASEDISSIKLMGQSNRRKYELSAESSRIGGKATMVSAVAGTAKAAYNIYKGPTTRTG